MSRAIRSILGPLTLFGLALACTVEPGPPDDASDPDGNGGEEGDGDSTVEPGDGDVSSSGGGTLEASGGSSSGGAESQSGGTSTGTGGTPLADTPGGMAGAPPETWTEHWFEHVQELDLVDHNDWVVLYADDDVDREQIGWMMEYFTDVWQYTVTHYGQFTDGTRDGRVYMIFHQGKYSGGHPSTYFDGSHDYRNVSDTGPGGWADGSYDIPTHEIAHIIEGASRGVHGSPAFGIWGDSKWAEFYLYDVFVALGKTAAAERVLEDFSNNSDNFPQAGTYWFRDWFYPLWRDHGGVSVMANFFQLLADHFPKNGNNFDGGLNFGQYVHFMSGAAGTNLKDMASTAFGWPAEREAQFVAAQEQFSGVTY